MLWSFCVEIEDSQRIYFISLFKLSADSLSLISCNVALLHLKVQRMSFGRSTRLVDRPDMLMMTDDAYDDVRLDQYSTVHSITPPQKDIVIKSEFRIEIKLQQLKLSPPELVQVRHITR